MTRLRYSFFAILCLLIVSACNEKPTVGMYSKYFANEDPVDLSDLLEIKWKSEKAEADTTKHYDLLSALLGKNAASYAYYYIATDTSSAIQLPEFANSKDPFLSRAEAFYNSCQFAFNIWRDYEIWLTEYSKDELEHEPEVTKGINGISENCIRNTKIRPAAKKYKERILDIIKSPNNADEAYEQANKAMADFTDVVEDEAYKFYANEEQFVDSLDSMTNELKGMTLSAYDEYVMTDSVRRVNYILHRLNHCKTFDEQCSLLLNWADSPLSKEEDEWITAVAYRLINSGKYNPCLNTLWIMWRSLFQPLYCGMSHSSPIPNDFYNSMRKKCFMTCINRLKEHPDDVFAINCASSIAGRVNLNRFGDFVFGNQAAAEEIHILPNRYPETK